MGFSLDYDTLCEVYRLTEDWNNDNYLHDQKNAMSFLEDRLAKSNTHLALLKTNSDYKEYVTEEFQNSCIDSAIFYTTSLLRYVQKTTKLPEMIQGLNDFNTDKGNLIDDYLSDFFNV